MHDIKLIRKSPEIFDESLKKRGENSKSLEIIALDAERRETIEKLEHLLSERKMLSKEVGASAKNNDITANNTRGDIKKIKHEISQLEATLKDIEKNLDTILLSIPNLLSDDVPVGQSEMDNVEVYRWGKINRSLFDLRNTLKLMPQKTI